MQLWGLDSIVSSPSAVQGGALVAKSLWCIRPMSSKIATGGNSFHAEQTILCYLRNEMDGKSLFTWWMHVTSPRLGSTHRDCYTDDNTPKIAGIEET